LQHQRPRERVLAYFDGAFRHPELKHGSRLPSTRQLAAELNVSQPTVQAVLRELAREGRVQTKAGSGTFFVSTSARPRKHLRIAVSVPISDGGRGHEWTRQICSGIFDAASTQRTPVTLMPLSAKIEATDSVVDQLLAQRSEVDGLILFPYTFYPDSVRDEVCSAYEREGKPVVFLHPPSETSTSNFVSPDYYGTCRRLGQAWQKTGRRRILLVTSAPLAQSVSLRLRQAGLVSGLGSELGKTISLRVWEMPEGVTTEEASKQSRALLDMEGWLPDAIYLASIHALELLAAIQERKLSVPADVSVVGGVTTADEAGFRDRLTHLLIPVHNVGEELLKMLCQRIEQKGASVPGRLLSVSIRGGATTRPEENALLGIERGETVL
jgi:DNA-binding LacI/PurR family transcriptional regulator